MTSLSPESAARHLRCIPGVPRMGTVDDLGPDYGGGRRALFFAQAKRICMRSAPSSWTNTDIHGRYPDSRISDAPAFPARASGHIPRVERRSPVTVAGPCRILTGFPVTVDLWTSYSRKSDYVECRRVDRSGDPPRHQGARTAQRGSIRRLIRHSRRVVRTADNGDPYAVARIRRSIGSTRLSRSTGRQSRS